MIKKLINKKTVYVSVVALVVQVTLIALSKNTYVNPSMMDFYIINGNYETLALQFFILLLAPLLISSILGKQFMFYGQSKKYIFSRTNQVEFVMKECFKTYQRAFLYTLLFYFMCYIFLFIIIKIPNVSISMGASIMNVGSIIGAYEYNSFLLIYILVFILIQSLCAIVYAAVGFYISLKNTNVVVIYLAPTIVYLCLLILSNTLIMILPFNSVNLIYFNNYTPISSFGLSSASPFFLTGGLVIVVLLIEITILSFFIKKTGDGDLC